MTPRCACGRPAELVDGKAAVCFACFEHAIEAEAVQDLEDEYGALVRGDAAPEEVNVARRQMRRVK